MMTDEEIRALLSKATPGPWSVQTTVVPGTVTHEVHAGPRLVCAVEVDGTGPYDPRDDADPRLLAASPDLAAEVLRLRAENKRLNGYHRYLAVRTLEDCEGKGCPGPGREAEELRKGLELLGGCGLVSAESVRVLLDSVDARDSLAYLEERDRAAAELTEARAEIAALRGLAEGAVGSGWAVAPWAQGYRVRWSCETDRAVLIAQTRETGEVLWHVWMRGALTVTTGDAPTLRAAMRAALDALGVSHE